MKRRFNNIEEICALCPELKSTLTGVPMMGRSGRTQQSKGLSTVNNLVVIANLVAELKASHTLEIGMAYGASTLAFLFALRSVSATNPYLHTAIDPFQKLDYDDCAVMAAERAGLADKLVVHYELSSIALADVLHSGNKFDLIYVDGSHLFEDVFVDAYFAVRLLREGGVVLFDDSADAHVARVIKFLERNLGPALERLDLSPWRTDLGGMRYQAAKLLGRVQLSGFKRKADPARAPSGTKLYPF